MILIKLCVWAGVIGFTSWSLVFFVFGPWGKDELSHLQGMFQLQCMYARWIVFVVAGSARVGSDVHSGLIYLSVFSPLPISYCTVYYVMTIFVKSAMGSTVWMTHMFGFTSYSDFRIIPKTFCTYEYLNDTLGKTLDHNYSVYCVWNNIMHVLM